MDLCYRLLNRYIDKFDMLSVDLFAGGCRKKFVNNLRAVEFCIVDEIHSLDNKRGVYLSLSLERLNEMSITWPVKIGLSATIAPLDEVAKFLVGISDERKVVADVLS